MFSGLQWGHQNTDLTHHCWSYLNYMLQCWIKEDQLRHRVNCILRTAFKLLDTVIPEVRVRKSVNSLFSLNRGVSFLSSRQKLSGLKQHLTDNYVLPFVVQSSRYSMIQTGPQLRMTKSRCLQSWSLWEGLGRILFQPHSDSWLNSIPCVYWTMVLISCWQTAGVGFLLEAAHIPSLVSHVAPFGNNATLDQVPLVLKSLQLPLLLPLSASCWRKLSAFNDSCVRLNPPG